MWKTLYSQLLQGWFDAGINLCMYLYVSHFAVKTSDSDSDETMAHPVTIVKFMETINEFTRTFDDISHIFRWHVIFYISFCS